MTFSTYRHSYGVCGRSRKTTAVDEGSGFLLESGVILPSNLMDVVGDWNCMGNTSNLLNQSTGTCQGVESNASRDMEDPDAGKYHAHRKGRRARDSVLRAMA